MDEILIRFESYKDGVVQNYFNPNLDNHISAMNKYLEHLENYDINYIPKLKSQDNYFKSIKEKMLKLKITTSEYESLRIKRNPSNAEINKMQFLKNDKLVPIRREISKDLYAIHDSILDERNALLNSMYL